MSEPRRASDAGRLRAWVVVLALAFVAVALQQSHRYQRLREVDAAPMPLDAHTAYRNSVRAFEFLCEEASGSRDPGCADARSFLRTLSRRRCEEAAAALERTLASGPEGRLTVHPLAPPFRAAYEQICEGGSSSPDAG